MKAIAYYNEHDPYAAQWLRNLVDAGHIPPGDVDERDIQIVTEADIDGYTQAHFFAGIGGWPLALRLAGWPDDRPVWTGSCPCQPFSSAGKRKGQKDERHLWPDFYRLIKACRPGIIFGEQVASADVVGRADGKPKLDAEGKVLRVWFDGICDDLEAAHYAVGAVDIPACCAGAEAEGWVVRGDQADWERIIVGAPHIRQRLYWLACDECAEPGMRVECVEGHEGSGRDRPAINGPAGGMGDSQQQGLEGHAGHGDDGREPGRVNPDAAGSVAATGIANAWSDFRIVYCRDEKYRRISAQPGDEPLAYGIPRDVGAVVARLVELGHSAKDAKAIIRQARSNRTGQLRGYGNAIVPELAAEFVAAAMEAIAERASA